MATKVSTQTEHVVLPDQQHLKIMAKDKRKLQFGDLSRELKELVVERVRLTDNPPSTILTLVTDHNQLLRPSDLKNVCLVSRDMHAIAVRFLYHNVAFDLGSPNDTRLSSFLSPKNIGLKHVKQLRLYLAAVYGTDKCNQEQQAQFATRMLLEFLPEDILEEFSWCPWKPFSTDNLMLLYRKQRKMKQLEVMDLDRDALPELKKSTRIQSRLFEHVKKLALYPENRQTLGLSGYFVEKTRERLEELIVHCNFHTGGDNSSLDYHELNDSATGPGLVSNIIFSCMAPFDQCTPFPNLKSLRLHRISLRHCADTWCKFINFHDLQFLRLYHCLGADTLFGQLSKSSHLPKQLKVLEFQHRDNSESEALIALDGFLCLVSGVRNLVIDLQNAKTMPASAGIARHGKTLELLNVHCTLEIEPTSIPTSDSDGDEIVWELEEFEKICGACGDLEQLSCAWPQTSLIRSHNEEWQAFEMACSLLRKLVTLHISTFPNNKPSTQLFPRAVYETLLQSLAQRGFELAAGEHNVAASSAVVPVDEGETGADTNSQDANSVKPALLRLIAFGTSDKIYEREDSRNQILYLRSTCTDAEGKEKVHATPVGWCLRQFIEPRSEVLDFVLDQSTRNNKPPCRERRDSAWGDEDE